MINPPDIGHPETCCGCSPGAHQDPPEFRERPSRRRLLRAGMAGSAGAVAGLGVGFGGSRAAPLQQPATPAAALRALRQGNARFQADRLSSVNEDLALVGDKAEIPKQKPFAAVLSCADSRVPVEWVFDVVIGRIFVTRVAGNIATPEIIASLEFGAAVLKTKLILVLGHEDCGAVDNALRVTAPPGQISSLYSYLRPGIDQANQPGLDAAIAANARFQADLLRRSSPVLRGLVKDGQLGIVSGLYNVRTGAVAIPA